MNGEGSRCGGWWVVVEVEVGWGVGKERLATIEGERRRRETCEAQVNEWRKDHTPLPPPLAPSLSFGHATLASENLIILITTAA